MRAWDGRIPGTPIVVDHFLRRPSACTQSQLHLQPSSSECFYFCTHAHSDHTVGLSANWSLGTLYCSHVTRALLLLQFGAAAGLDRRIIALDTEQPHTIVTHRGRAEDMEEETFVAPDAELLTRKRKRVQQSATGAVQAETFTVTLFPSNHCPGSVMFAFQSGAFGTILHTGDFRYDPTKFHFGPLHALIGQVDLLYFDATFFTSECVFPKKYEAIRETIAAIKSMKEKHARELRGQQLQQPAPGPCPPELDWRVYLSCEGLGSEELLASVSTALNQPFFADESNPSMRLRAEQLKLLALKDHDAGPVLIVTDPRQSHCTNLHLAPGGNFQRFAQSNRMERAEAKRRWRIEQESQQSKLHASTMHAYSPAAAAAVTSASASFSHPALPTPPPPLSLYIKPSTLWFLSNVRSACAARQLPLSSSYLARPTRIGHMEESIAAAYFEATANAPKTMPLRAEDRFGVTHLLYSMHSDYNETIEFIRFMRPRCIAPINIPMALQKERHQQRYSSQGHAPEPMYLSIGPGSAECLEFCDRMLRLKLSVEEMPLLRSCIDYRPTPRQNQLTRQQRALIAQQVQRMKEWDAAQLQQQATTHSQDDSPCAGSTSTPAAAVPRAVLLARDEKRLKLLHPVSPLDALGGGQFGSRFSRPLSTRLTAPRTQHLSVPFNPRQCSELAVHLERDIAPHVRAELRERLERLGCRVTEWQESAPLPTPQSLRSVSAPPTTGSWSLDSYRSAASQFAPAGTAAAPGPPSDAAVTLPPDITFIFLALDRPSSAKLLLPVVIQQIEELIRSSNGGQHASSTHAAVNAVTSSSGAAAAAAA
ncbi:MAG: hypothetical protein P4L10_14165, partial [Acidobacteriaceae bacterium]|nr:hypothetical protein [Acidobacteriaceae bacterium]